MKFIFLLILATFTPIFSEKISYRDFTLYKILPKDLDSLNALRSLDEQSSDLTRFRFWYGPSRIGILCDLMVAPELKNSINKLLGSLNVDSEILTNDVQKLFDEENIFKIIGDDNPVNWTIYNTFDEISTWLQGLADEYPDTVTVIQPGKSYENRNIIGVKVDYDSNKDKKAVFIESNMHGRDWISSAVTTYILNEFLSSENETILDLAKKYTWYFFPIMNPDGFVYSHETDRLWRKTRIRYNIFCWGADPNRNFEYEWMKVPGASQNPCSEYYAGPEPYSEPSTAVMKAFISSIGQNMIAYVGFYSYGQKLMLPYGHTTEHLENYDEMKEVGEIAINNLTSLYGTKYEIGNMAEILYLASGTIMDWIKSTFNVPIAYSYKLRDTGTYGFALPSFLIIPTAEETLVSLIAIFDEYEKRHPSFQ